MSDSYELCNVLRDDGALEISGIGTSRVLALVDPPGRKTAPNKSRDHFVDEDQDRSGDRDPYCGRMRPVPVHSYGAPQQQ
jgi:hypothetical protein